MPAWLACNVKTLDLLLSKIGFVSVPLFGAQTKYTFSRVVGASSLDVSSICFCRDS